MPKQVLKQRKFVYAIVNKKTGLVEGVAPTREEARNDKIFSDEAIIQLDVSTGKKVR